MTRWSELFLASLAACWLAEAGPIALDFETFGDGTGLTNQYGGFLFANTKILSAGLSLNEVEFPPHSGTNVAGDFGGQVSITFSIPVLTFSGFFTYSTALTINAFDSLNSGVGTTNSAFSSNVTSSGRPTDEFLSVAFAGGISRLNITGNPAGSSFVLDDAEVTIPGSDVPEPSTSLLIVAGLMFVFRGIKGRRRFAVR